MKDNNLHTVLKSALIERNNPLDMTEIVIGKVEQLSPIIVSINETKTLLEENEELFISEWFRFRCDIDKTEALSSGVPSDLSSARGVTETHSYGGASCNMPSAIDYVAKAIEKVTAELLALKCDLKKGDLVVLGSLEQLDKYILIDKVL